MPSSSPVLTLLATTALLASLAAAAPVKFTDVDRGEQSNIDEPREVVVRTAAEWTALWRVHGGQRPKPAVDFSRSMLIGVFLGSRPSGGYGLEITAIDTHDAGLTVTWRESRPTPRAVVTQVLTMPYHIVRVDRRIGSVVFKKREIPNP